MGMDVQRCGWVHDLGWAVQKFTHLGEALLSYADSASLGREPGIPIFKKPSPPPIEVILT